MDQIDAGNNVCSLNELINDTEHVFFPLSNFGLFRFFADTSEEFLVQHHDDLDGQLHALGFQLYLTNVDYKFYCKLEPDFGFISVIVYQPGLHSVQGIAHQLQCYNELIKNSSIKNPIGYFIEPLRVYHLFKQRRNRKG